jgi:hypothetical protein
MHPTWRRVAKASALAALTSALVMAGLPAGVAAKPKPPLPDPPSAADAIGPPRAGQFGPPASSSIWRSTICRIPPWR